jgi:hypothetical protein
VEQAALRYRMNTDELMDDLNKAVH